MLRFTSHFKPLMHSFLIAISALSVTAPALAQRPDLSDPQPDLVSVQLVAGKEGLFQEDRSLLLQRQGSPEILSVVYFKDNRYQEEELQKIYALMKDSKTSKVHPIALDLIDSLWILQKMANVFLDDAVIVVNSAYRSFSTNRQNKGAKRSLHLSGNAVDFKINGINLDLLHNAAKELNLGGVGIYLRRHSDGWIHLDNGPGRFWRG